MLAVVEIKNNLLAVSTPENNSWSKLKKKVEIKSRTFQLNLL